ncbi:type I restriction endonuclease subunit M [Aliivibrio sifiae]
MTHSTAINSTITKETQATNVSPFEQSGVLKNESIQSKEPIPFFLGTVILTQGINILCQGEHEAMDVFVKRHALCDWGTSEDWEMNNEATHNGDRIISQYDFQGTTIWIITEHDRSVTTILLPNEY